MTSEAIKTLFREFRAINRQSVYDNQAKIEFPNGEEDPCNLEIHLLPRYGPFRGAAIRFKVTVPANYPNSAPSFSCLTKIYHPNFSFTGSICFSMFSEWNKEYRLEHCINGLLWLLHNPNPQSALNGQCIFRGKSEFENNVRRALHGMTVNGVSYSLAIDSEYSNTVYFERFQFLMSDLIGSAGKSVNAGELPSFALSQIFSPQFQQQAESCPMVNSLRGINGLVMQLTKVKTLNTVHKRSIAANVAASFVLKELVWEVADQTVLVITNGHYRVNPERLAEICRVSPDQVRLVKSADILTKVGWNSTSIPAFGQSRERVSKIVFNTSILNFADQPIYCSIGLPMCLLKIMPAELLKAIHASNVPVVMASDFTDNTPRSVSLSLHFETQYGETVKVCGSAPELGSWDPEKAHTMRWHEGHLWATELQLDTANLPVEFKFVFVDKEGRTRWENGNNRVLTRIPHGLRRYHWHP